MNAPPLIRESKVLAKARQHGLAGPEDLEQLAIERGCDYYDLSNVVREEAPRGPRAPEFSNEELAIALLIPSHRSLLRTRMGAAMLGASGNDPTKVGQLAVEEDCADLVRHIASCGHQVEGDNGFWTALTFSLGGRAGRGGADDEGLPHLTRFVEMTGISRGKVGTQMRWIRPTKNGHG